MHRIVAYASPLLFVTSLLVACGGSSVKSSSDAAAQPDLSSTVSRDAATALSGDLAAADTGPTIAITSHASGAKVIGARAITLAGTLSDASMIASVTVTLNGGSPIAATFDQSTFSVGLTLADRENAIVVTATDAANNAGTANLTLNYPWLALTTFQKASIVIGQADFTSGHPDGSGGVGDNGAYLPYGNPAAANGALYLGDSGNNRVLGFNAIPTANGARADFVLGEPDFATDTGGTAANQLDGAQTLISFGGKLLEDDYRGNRLVIWNALPATTRAPADYVIGQADFGLNVADCDASTLKGPESFFYAGDKLIVGDSSHNRVLIWNQLPAASGVAADLVLGQPDMTTCTPNTGGSVSATSMWYPTDAWTDGTRLFVADYSNNRILVWNTFPTANGQAADFALGQPDLTSGAANSGGLSAASLYQPYYLACNGNQLFVADSSNSRILVYDSLPTSNVAADLVIGQSDFAHNKYDDDDQDGNADSNPAARTMSSPSGLLLYQDKLIVTDEGNNRWLIFQEQPVDVTPPTITITSHASGAKVIGARAITLAGTLSDASAITSVTVTLNGAPVTATFDQSTFSVGLALANRENVIVVTATDAANNVGMVNLTLDYPWLTLTTFQEASVVIGQADFTSGQSNHGGSVGDNGVDFPYGSPTVANGILYLGDHVNNRVLGYNAIPTANGASADFVLGQADFASTGSGLAANQLNGAQTLISFGGKLIEGDHNGNRLVIWNALPATSQAPADYVIGQVDFGLNATTCDASTLQGPEGLFYAGDKLIVADSSHNRVLIWNQLPTASGVAADLVLGQPDMTTCTPSTGGGVSATSMQYPTDAWTDGTRLFVADLSDNRVLIWNTFPTANGQAADFALGQPDLTTGDANSGGLSAVFMDAPYFLACNGNQLFVADSGNSRILVYDSPPTSNVPADIVIGQSDFTHGWSNDDDQDGVDDGQPSARAMTYPSGLFLYQDKLIVTDVSNNRWLIFQEQP